MAERPRRSILSRLKIGLMALAVAAFLPAGRADVTSFNADDLRGTWVFTFRIVVGNQVGAIYYAQISMGGNASAGNSTVEVLSGGTLQEAPGRTATGGSITVTPQGSVSGTINLIDPNATGSTMTLALTGVNQTAGARLRYGMQEDKNTILGEDNTATGAVEGNPCNDSHYGATIAINPSALQGNAVWSATKISDMEVMSGGNNAGQACFLSAARRR